MKDAALLKNMRLHHIGYACEDINSTIAFIEKIYTISSISDVVFDSYQKAYVCEIKLENGTNIELVSGERVKNLITQGINLYHTCYEVKDIDNAIELFKQSGGIQVTDSHPAKLFNHKRVVFFQTKIGLIELLEIKDVKDETSKQYKEKILLAGTFCVNSIAQTLSDIIIHLNFPYKIQELDNFHQNLYDENNIFNKHANLNILLLREADFPRDDNRKSLRGFITALEQQIRDSTSSYIICCFAKNNNYLNHVNTFEEEIRKKFLNIKNVSFIIQSDITSQYEINNYFNTYGDKIAQIPFNEQFDFALSAVILKKIYALFHNNYKVITVDCDNTLWSGVCGEDSLSSICINDSNKYLQEILISLHKIGFLICIVSKNNETDVKNIFLHHSDMLLSLEHITSWQVNWRQKRENIFELSKILNLPLSSFIFIDDNPLECKELEASLPEVLTVNITENFKETKQVLQNLLAFKKLNTHTSGMVRKKWYDSHLKREISKNKSSSLTDFINKLKLQVTIKKVQNKNITRISELSYRVTQFNFSNKKYKESDLEYLLSKGFQIISVELKDIYGDYGIVGVAIFNIKNDSIYIDSFMLSCRALNKGVEYKILHFLTKTALKHNLNHLEIDFQKSERNEPAYQFLNHITALVSFSTKNTNVYKFPTDELQKITFDPDREQNKSSLISNRKKNTESYFSSADIKFISNSLSSIKAIYKLLGKAEPIKKSETINLSLSGSLKKIWRSTLNCKNVSNQSDFFEMGGTSLLTLRLATEIYEHFQIEIKIQEIFQNSKFKNLLACLKKNIHRKIKTPKQNYFPKLKKNMPSTSFPLSSNQKSLWLIDKFIGTSWFYNISSAYTIKGALNINALEKAIDSIISTHASLRFFVSVKNNQPALMTESKNKFHLIIHNISKYNNKQVSEFINRIELDPIPIDRYPLYRFCLLKISPEFHIFVMVFHHLIFDGWSEGVFNRLLQNAYNNYANHQPCDLKTSTYSYEDYIYWQNQFFISSSYQDSLNYWQKKLAGFKTLNFPLTHKRKEAPTYDGKYSYFLVPKNTFNSLKLLEKDHKTTTFNILYSAFALLLHKYSNQEDITIGAPFSGRILKEFEEIIGNFVNTVALRINIFPDMTIEELIMLCHQTVFESYENQLVPFQEIVKKIPSSRNGNITPVFQIMMVLQDAQNQKLCLNGLELDFYRRGYDAARMDLILEFNIIEGQLDGGIYYNKELFDEIFITNVTNNYLNILEVFTKSSAIKIGEIALSKKNCGFTTNKKNSSSHQTPIHKYLEEITTIWPNKTAIKYKDHHLTYSCLNKYANQLAHYLLTQDIKIGDIVGLCLERSKDIIITILACFKIGATYVPIDPDLPDQYKSIIFADCNPKILLTNIAVTHAKKFFKENIVDLKKLLPNMGYEFSELDPILDIPASTAAYIIYTSGTTGTPKGVIINHSSITNLIIGLRDIYKISEMDIGVLFHSYSFDMSVWEIWSILAFGGSLLILDKPNIYSSKELWDIFITENITILNQTPTVFENILLNTNLKLLKKHLKLRLLIFGGEALYPRHLLSWVEVFNYNSPEIYNMYGITETTVHTSYRKIDKLAIESNKSLIGFPIPGVEMILLDKALQPVSINEVGEIYVSGKGLANGYLNKPKLTKRFFIQINGKKWYKSGDLGKLMKNKELEYIGRADTQIKLHGFRIDLQGVTSKINSHKGICKSYTWLHNNGNKEYIHAAAIPDIQSALPVIRYLELIRKSPNFSKKFNLLPNDMRILHHNKPETTLQYQEIFIDKEYLKHGIYIKKGDTILDVGANIGMCSLFFGCHFKNIKIFAFEVIPEIYELLQTNLWLYNIDAKCFNYGISDTEEYTDFVYFPNVSVLSGKNPDIYEVKKLLENTLDKNSSSFKDIESLNELIQAKSYKSIIKSKFRKLSKIIEEENIEKINLLKIDVERHELQVLKGIHESDWEKIDQIIVEVHDYEDNLSSCQNLLESKKYNITIDKADLLKTSRLYTIYAKKNNFSDKKCKKELGLIYNWCDIKKLSLAIKNYLRSQLPSYMCPSNIYLIDQFPVTLNGKIDSEGVKKLVDILKHENRKTQKIPLPDNSIKSKLLNIWQNLLSIPFCTIDDNFFDLGGDSFLLVQLHHQIFEKISSDLKIIDLFTYTTIRSQAEFLESKIAGKLNEVNA